ncbi:MAG: ATP-binding cassette domain-containing protein [Hyphomicrobiales bacterium]|nr:ATP-binding cassette domain-containing protein [Hyphomicrobiales bacterium]
MRDDVRTLTPALDIQGVSHRYGARKALNGVTFTVAPTSFTALLGLNGAGKSTLFSLITRLYATREGRISIYGRDVAREPSAALGQLGIVFQSRALDTDISVEQNLIYHAALHGLGRREALACAHAALSRVDLADRLHERVNKLSGGQMRRVEIARALLHRPRLLLLDEPTVGLDVKARAGILRHVRALLAEERIGVLWATHLIDEAMPGDDVVILHRGRVLAHGPIHAVIARCAEKDLAGAFRKLTHDSGSEDEGAAE